jgi:TIR domain
MSGIFISYRRVDSRTYSGRFFDRLSHHFGSDRVFMDVEGGIARGDDFAKTIESAVASVAAMVVVIGRQWLTCSDAGGGRRLDNPDDWVREEITIALNRGILLLPVLVDGASMPTERELPQALQALARRQASEISDSRWDYDVGEIIKALERVVPPGPLAHSNRQSIWTSSSFRRALKWVGGTAAALLGVVVLLIVWESFFAAKPSDYDFTVDPPQARIRRNGSTVQTVHLTVTNTGKRAAPINISPSFYSWTPSAGVLVIRDDTCKTQQIAPGEMCTANVVFDPKWLVGDELEIRGGRVNGELYILLYGNGRSIPLTIEAESDLPATQDDLKPPVPSTRP